MSSYKYEAYEKRYVWRNQATGVPVSPQTGHRDCSAVYGGDDYNLCMKISGHVDSEGNIDASHYYYDPYISSFWVHVYRGYMDGCPQHIIDVAHVGGIVYEPPEEASIPEGDVRFNVFVRDQNNMLPVPDAKVSYNGIVKYTDSIGYTDSFTAKMNTQITYIVSKSGYQTLTRGCWINRDNDLCTPYLIPDVDCECGHWINQGCARDNYRKETRMCTPEGCNNQWREVYDTSCATEYKANIHHWWITSETEPEPVAETEHINATVGETITVAGAMLHNYPGAEDFKWYVVDEDTREDIIGTPSVSLEPGILHHTRLYFKMPSKNLKARIELRRTT